MKTNKVFSFAILLIVCSVVLFTANGCKEKIEIKNIVSNYGMFEVVNVTSSDTCKISGVKVYNNGISSDRIEAKTTDMVSVRYVPSSNDSPKEDRRYEATYKIDGNTTEGTFNTTATTMNITGLSVGVHQVNLSVNCYYEGEEKKKYEDSFNLQIIE